MKLKQALSAVFDRLAEKAVKKSEEYFAEEVTERAESEAQSVQGRYVKRRRSLAKKRFAVDFVLAKLPMSGLWRQLAGSLIVELMDIAIERAVEKQKGLEDAAI